MTLLSLDNIPALQDEVRALAAERGAVILAHNYQLPEIQEVADYVGDSLGLSQQAAAHRRRRDRVLRRALHGRDGLDPVPGEDRAAAGPRRRLLAGRLDHRAAAARLEGQAPRRGRRHVRQHHGRGEGGDRLLRDLVQRRRGRRAHLPRARRGHRDPVRPGHVPRRVRREAHGQADARLGRRVPRPRRHPPARHRARCAPRTRAPTSSSTPSAAARPRSWSTWPPATSTPRACTCSRPAGCSSYARTAAAGRDGDRGDRDRDAAPAARGRARTSTSSPPTRRRAAAT